MALLSVSNLTFRYGDTPILDGANLTLEAGDRVGLVGRNGTGKSTLLKLIGGESELRPHAGQIQVARGATTGVLAQEPAFTPGATLRAEAGRAFAGRDELERRLAETATRMESAESGELEELMKRYEALERRLETAGGYQVAHEVERTLRGLGIGEATFDVPVEKLSGGQKNRLALAKLLIAGPDVLLLDEPTNHLDIAGRQWLESFLAGYAGAVMVISHDRWLLDRAVNAICELEGGGLVPYPGGYERYRALRAERRAAQQRAYDKQQQAIRKEQDFIDRYGAGQRAKQARGRAKRLERYKRDEAIAAPQRERDPSLAFAPTARSGRKVVEAEGVTVAHGETTLFRDVSLVIERGSRLGVIGPNGAGKTTLVECLLGTRTPSAGTARLGAQVSVGHFRQTPEDLDPEATPVDYLRPRTPNGTTGEARALAGAMLFSEEAQDRPLGVLSGGERVRAALAGLMGGKHNLLVLDEPTNHLDIASAECLETALSAFTTPPASYGTQRAAEGTLILISHDRSLLDNLVDELLVLDGQGGWQRVAGNYSAYLAQAEPAEKGASARSAPAAAAGGSRRGGAGKAAEARPHQALNQKRLEERIEEIEHRLAAIDRSLADPAETRDGDRVRELDAERAALRAELEPLEAEWTRRAAG